MENVSIQIQNTNWYEGVHWTITFVVGIYEMFCREIFGKKPKKLDFGLQPHRIPDSETVRNHFVVHFIKKKRNFCPIWVKCCILRFSVGVVPDALLQRPLCSVSSCSGQSAFLHQAERAPRSAEGGCEAPGGRRSELLVWCRLGQRYKQTVYDCPPDVHNYELYLTALSSFCLTEDAKRMAIKEEQYDPGYEVAFGGAYGESAPEGGQSNGYCNFSTSEEKGWYHLSSPADAAEKAPTNPNTAGQVQDSQWMMQSFADQIPDIGNSSQAQSWGVWGRTVLRDFRRCLSVPVLVQRCCASYLLSVESRSLWGIGFFLLCVAVTSLLRYNFRTDLRSHSIVLGDPTCTRRIQWLLCL